MQGKKQIQCCVCKKMFNKNDVVPAALVRESVTDIIREEHPEFSRDCFICRTDLAEYRTKYIDNLLKSEKGDLSELEKKVLSSLKKQELISSNIDSEYEKNLSFGERLSDKIAAFGGSWAFLISFAIFLFIWIAINSLVLFWHPVDPYPFILLNLLLSCLAAIQAPIIMMSQNRQEAKDRLRSVHDYQVNLKAELEIRQISEKLDHLLMRQWERLAKIQEVQTDMLTELNQPRAKSV